MSNILVAWEFGENWGHLSRDVPVAVRLVAAGHNVLCAVADTRVAASMLATTRINFVQSPSPRRPARPPRPLANHAEIAMTGGYDDPDILRGLVGGWRGIIELFRPDALLIDYAPTALLAGRICGVPAVLAGSGFELPPPLSPLPSFRVWETVSESRLLEAEQTALRHVNQVLDECKAAPLQQFSDLFQGQRRILTTFAELDHFGARPTEEYVGPLFDLPRARRVQWHPGGSGEKRIFAYLRPWMPRVEDLLIALQGSGADVICTFPSAPPGLVQRYQSPRLRIFTQAVDLGPLLPTADLVIAYGSGTVAQALLAGIPLLLVPRWAEQYLSALRVEALGAGLVVRGKGPPPSYPALLERLQSDPQYRTAARRFATQYAGFNAAESVSRLASIIEGVARQSCFAEHRVDFSGTGPKSQANTGDSLTP